MDSSAAKTAIYVLIVLAVVAFLGLAVMKINGAAKSHDTTPLTQSQRLDQLEKSPGVTSEQGKEFLQNEKSRQDATKDVFDQTVPGQ